METMTAPLTRSRTVSEDRVAASTLTARPPWASSPISSSGSTKVGPAPNVPATYASPSNAIHASSAISPGSGWLGEAEGGGCDSTGSEAEADGNPLEAPGVISALALSSGGPVAFGFPAISPAPLTPAMTAVATTTTTPAMRWILTDDTLSPAVAQSKTKRLPLYGIGARCQAHLSYSGRLPAPTAGTWMQT